jgi:hypothetical protein
VSPFFASAQFFDFLDLAQKFTFLNWKLVSAQLAFLYTNELIDKKLNVGTDNLQQKLRVNRNNGRSL